MGLSNIACMATKKKERLGLFLHQAQLCQGLVPNFEVYVEKKKQGERNGKKMCCRAEKKEICQSNPKRRRV